MQPKETFNKKTKLALVFTLMLTLLNMSIITAQKKYEISAQVKDKQTHKALEFCTVKIMTLKDSLLGGTSTNMKGYFTTMLPRGKYKISVDYLGYEQHSTTVTVSGKDLFLGTINMKLSSNDIAEVAVKAASSENKLDRDVTVVTSKLKSGASNTKDVLDKIQGIQYDRYNNSIKVDNSENIILLVDGLEKDPEYIKNLDPERLQKVELIRDPGGKYGLDGYTAVINVILKTNYRGRDISLSSFSLADPKSKDSKFLIPNAFNRISINNTVEKLNMYASAYMYSNNFLVKHTNSKIYKSGLSIETISPDGEPNNISDNLGDGYNIGLDYKINPKHTISIEGNFGGLLGRNNSENNSKSIYKQNNVEMETLDIFSKNNKKNKRQKYNLYYIGQLNTKMSVNATANYKRSTSDFDNLFKVGNNSTRKEKGESETNNTKLYAEFNYDITPKSSIQLGYGFDKMSSKSVSNLVKADAALPGTQSPRNEFNYRDTRHRSYAYYSINPSRKWGVKLGMAAEFSKPENDSYTNTFEGYQPFLNIKYVPAKFLNIRIKYRSSSSFPSLSQTDPTEYLSDNNSVTKGNPNLVPSVNHRMSVRFNIMKGLASIEPYYNFSDNKIAQIATLRQDDIIEYSYANIGNYNKKGIKAALNIPFGKKIFWKNNANIYKSQITYQDNDNKVSDWSINSQLVYMNRKKAFFAGLTYRKYNTRYIRAQGYRSSGNDMWGVFARKSFFKNRLSVMTGYVLPIDWGIRSVQENYKETNVYTELSQDDISVIKNMLFVHVSFRFSKGKTRKKVFTDTDEDESQGKTLF